MKNNIRTLFLLLSVFATSFLGCKDVLDIEAKNAFAEDLIYKDPVQVERLVFSAYNSTDGWGGVRSNWWLKRVNIEIGSFETKFNFLNKDWFNLQAGWASGNAGALGAKWELSWQYVRSINEFLDKVDNCEAMATSPELVKGYKAEMRFLRANLYSKLLKYYGGVPIMTHALGLTDDFNLSRNSYKECVDFIVSDLDAAIAELPASRPDTEFGRATKLSAMAVKARTLLYAASALHDQANVPAENSELYSYPVSTKWQDVADAAKAIIDEVGARDLEAVVNATEYQALFLSNENKDILFARAYSKDYYEWGEDASTLPDQVQSPSGYGGWGASSPTHNFTLQFNMKDGTSTDGGSFDALNPNNDREMRYYADILYNGAEFRGRDVQYYLSDKMKVKENGDTIYLHGLDSQLGGSGHKAHSSKTGYNIRKFQDETIGSLNALTGMYDGLTNTSAKRPYILCRLAEVYLNYAEAQYHLDNESEARKYLNKVSTRALQPEITSSGTELLEAIKRERRVELCFEGHNFFDERRWMNPTHLGFDIKGLKWHEDKDGALSFKEYTVLTRPWFDRQYYLPIPQSEVEKAPNLVQNAGY